MEKIQKTERKGAAVQGKDQKQEKSRGYMYRKEYADQEGSWTKIAESMQSEGGYN